MKTGFFFPPVVVEQSYQEACFRFFRLFTKKKKKKKIKDILCKWAGKPRE